MHMEPQVVHSSHVTGSDNTPPRVELTHYLLRLASHRLIHRHRAGTNAAVRWRVLVEGQHAPDQTLWALETITRWELIVWLPAHRGIEVAWPTPDGAEVLAAWDAELMGGAL